MKNSTPQFRNRLFFGFMIVIATCLVLFGARPSGAALANTGLQAKTKATATPKPDAASDEHEGDGERHAHSGGTFSMVVPEGWTWSEADAYIILRDTSSDAFVAIGSAADEPDLTVKGMADGYIKSDASFKKAKNLGAEEIHFGTIVTSSLKYQSTQSAVKLNLRIALGRQFGNLYVLIVRTPAKLTDAQQQEIDGVLESIEFHNQTYGVERSQTLTLLGELPDQQALDPAINRGSAAGYPGYLFSGLVRLSSKLQIEPDLAETWRISPDGTTYTFTLRAGLTFADGHALTASDVKYSWERAADPALGSNTATNYLGDIVGITRMAEGTAEHADGIRVIDPRTLVVTLDAPKAYFLAKLTYPTAYVVDSRDVVADPEDWFLHPNASGPYQVKQLVENRAVVLERNENYFQPARIPNVLFLLNPGGSPLSVYQAGDLDLVYINDEQFAEIDNPAHALNADLRSLASMCVGMLQIDTAQSPTDDPNVRRAIAQAIDWDTLYNRANASTDHLETSILPPGMPGYMERDNLNPFDVKAAKAWLAKSKYAGKKLMLTVSVAGQAGSQGTFTPALVEMLQTNLGAKVKIEYLGREYVKAARAQHGNLVPYGWCADYPDPQNFLDILFHSASSNNLAGYNNAEVDALLEQARSEPDGQTRLELYQRIETMILADTATLPYSGGEGHLLVKPYLHGYEPSPIGIKISNELYFEEFPVEP